MFCQKCGTQLADNVVFCSSCGNQIAAAGAPQVQNPHVPQIPQFQVNSEAGLVAATMIIGCVMLISLFLPWAQARFYSLGGSVTYIQLCQFMIDALNSKSRILNDAPLILLLIFVPGILTLHLLTGPIFGGPLGEQARKAILSPLKNVDPKGWEKIAKSRLERVMHFDFVSGRQSRT